jgi:hypothetical protein
MIDLIVAPSHTSVTPRASYGHFQAGAIDVNGRKDIVIYRMI